MKKQIEQVLADTKLRNDLIARGQQRIREFSWKKLAQQTLDVYYQSI